MNANIYWWAVEAICFFLIINLSVLFIVNTSYKLLHNDSSHKSEPHEDNPKPLDKNRDNTSKRNKSISIHGDDEFSRRWKKIIGKGGI